jgi:cholest-4-en-3-one 26-monooxygenase
VADVAVPLPLAVLARLMGIPDSDIPRLYTWTHEIERAQHAAESSQGLGVFGEMVGYLHPLIQRQAESGEENLVTRLRDARVDGESLTEEQVLGFFSLLVFAGNDTTRNTAATGMLALLQHPEQWALLRAEPGRVPNAVEEVLRWTSVVKHFVRTATADTELGGTAIAEGDRLVMWFDSASRDAALNADPDRFDITRANPQHRAFGGGGPHFCLGNALARLELRLLFEEVARRMPDIALDGEPTYLASNWVHGLTTLPVRW